MSQNSRRSFFSQMVKVVGVMAVAPSFVMAEEKRAKKGGADAGGDLPWVKAGEGTAKALNYHTSYSEVKDAALKADRGGVPFGANQTCGKCMLFAATGKKDGKDAGKCTLFAGALVPAEGWCASWSKKA